MNQSFRPVNPIQEYRSCLEKVLLDHISSMESVQYYDKNKDYAILLIRSREKSIGDWDIEVLHNKIIYDDKEINITVSGLFNSIDEIELAEEIYKGICNIDVKCNMCRIADSFTRHSGNIFGVFLLHKDLLYKVSTGDFDLIPEMSLNKKEEA